MDNNMAHASLSNVIMTNDLALGYRGHFLIEHLSIDIQQGEFIAILGSNGSGKSTFLKALLGLIKPMHGDIRLLGSNPERGNTQIGYMPQMRSETAAAYLTSRAILEAAYQGTRYGMPFLNQQGKNDIQAILHMVKAEAYADRPFYQLSGGERQRIFLAQALLGAPRILLLDEPLASLDPHYQEAFIQLLHHIQQHLKVTILFTAHDPNPLLHVIRRVLYFAKGKAAIGTVTETMTNETLSALYGTAIEVIHFKDRLFVLGENLPLYGQDNHHA